MYGNNLNNLYPRQNILPPQQILQANGKASVDMLQLSPNSSVLIADTTAPIVWKCVSDSLGNVTSEAFDIIPHKDEAQIQQETLEQRISRLEEIINEQSFIKQQSTDEQLKTDNAGNKRSKKSSGNAKSNDTEQS